MLDVDFALYFPSSGYFVSVNLMMEFTNAGQIVPTRLDVLPYKLGPFASYNAGPGIYIALFKFSLVIYTAGIVIQNFQQKKTFAAMFKAKTIGDNGQDIFITFIQTYTFTLKIQDSIYFNINPKMLLEPADR